MSSSDTAPVPAGWYADPGGDGRRYWDGARWTEHVAAPDPAPAPLPAALTGHVAAPLPAGLAAPRPAAGDARPSRRALSVLILPVQVVAMAGGLLVVSRLSGSYIRALIFGAVWLLVSALVFGKLAKAWAPAMRIPVRVVSLVVGLGIAGWVFYSSVHKTTVDETVVTGVSPAAGSRGGGGGGGGGGASRPVNVAGGRFSELAEGSAKGTATVVRLPDGGQRLTLTDFEVAAGPDLRVYLTTAKDSGRGAVGDHEDLGGLKGERGNQQYVVPEGTDLSRFSVVLIYCRSFSVGFARAPLEPE